MTRIYWTLSRRRFHAGAISRSTSSTPISGLVCLLPSPWVFILSRVLTTTTRKKPNLICVCFAFVSGALGRSIFRAGTALSKFASSMKRHADLYMSSVDNLRFYSVEQRFYPDGGHESVPFIDPLLDYIIGDDDALT
uniref:Uncharacterized protein n=1 Tax=Lotharella globosa TaxID=91324 RepID=A0A7S3YWH9_9EUKA